MASLRRNNATRGTIDTSRPIGEGAFRVVYKGHYTKGEREGQPLVAKWFKTGVVFESRFYSEDIRAVDKAQDIINAFNNEDIIDQYILLNEPEVWTFVESSERAGQKHLVEPYIEDFCKFNSNTGVVFDQHDAWSQAMQALSHYSYHASGGSYVLCDLQGGMTDEGMTLTDPVILSRSGTRAYGATDLSLDGISTFFARHRCTKFCQSHWQQPRHQAIYFPAARGTTFM